MKLLEGKCALVTGGSSGIGFAIAKKYLEHGASLVLWGTNKEKGEKACQELAIIAPSAQIHFMQVDVANTTLVESTMGEVLKKWGKLDILVNNAGITRDQLLMKMGEKDWDDVLNTNAKSCFNTCRAAIRSMLKARQGKIINISSVVGITGNPGQANYAASKGAIIAFSKALALEVASRHVTVNCIAPGFIATQMTDALTEEQKRDIILKIPFGRMGIPENVADAALFLASDLSSYMTGQVLTVDGGMVM